MAKYKTLYAELSPTLKEEFQTIVENNGKFSALDLGLLCVKHQIPLTVMDDWLPEITDFAYASGTWERLRKNGVKAKDIGVAWSLRCK